MSLPGETIEINGIGYHVSDQGESDRAVLLLHGMPDTSSVWKHQVPALLDAGFRVVAPDLLGYGKTDKPQEVERYDGELIVADTLGLIEALDLEQLDVVGHDWGAFIGWELTLRFPKLFRRHVTFQVGHPGIFFCEVSGKALKENWFMYLNAQAASAELYALNNCEFWSTYIVPTHPEPQEMCERLSDPVAMNAMLNWDRANQPASFYLAHALGQLEYSKCQVPTLGVWSKGDVHLWEEQMVDSERLMDAEWRYERMEEGSHWVMLDHPDEVNRLLLSWLTGSDSVANTKEEDR